jgi:hypothetical protein
VKTKQLGRTVKNIALIAKHNEFLVRLVHVTDRNAILYVPFGI